MRGADQPQTTLFSYLSVEDRIPADHPLRTIHALSTPILTALSPRFDALCDRIGRQWIPPERLLRAVAAGALHHSERTPVDGAAQLQSALPLVRGPESR